MYICIEEKYERGRVLKIKFSNKQNLKSEVKNLESDQFQGFSF